MICPSCQTENANRNVFCNNCGTLLKDTDSMVGDTKSPTLSFQFPPEQPPSDDSFEEETPTVFGQNPIKIPPAAPIAEPQTPPPTQVFDSANQSQNVSPNQPAPEVLKQNFMPTAAPAAQAVTNSGRGKRIALLAGILLIGLAAIGVGGFFIVKKLLAGKPEVLPEQVGIFLQSKEKDKLDEIKKQDFSNALEGKDKLLKDEGLLKVESKPNLVLFADEKDFKSGDLRLIQLDTIKPDGTLKQIDFQTSAVENKTEIKRISLSEGLANGKYAFAVLDGFLDDGKHKFWAFQVTNSDKANNDSILKNATVSIKSKDKKKNDKTPETPPTVDSYIYPKTNGVTLRSEPSLTADKVDTLKSSDRLYVMKISDNTSVWRGTTGYWANVKTDDGRSGWVFAPLLKR
jgi:hypothetical protein